MSRHISYKCQYVVGKRTYAKKSHVERISVFATPSDEALVLLLYENSFDRWKNMAKTNNTKKSSVMPKYTNGGVSAGITGSSKKYGGWSDEGLNRFNELYEQVEKDRAADEAKGFPFEEAFRIYALQTFNENNHNHKRKRNDVDDNPRPPIGIKNDLWTTKQETPDADEVDCNNGSDNEDEEGEGDIHRQFTGIVTQRVDL